MVLDRWFALWFSCRRRKYYYVIKFFKILVCGIKDKFILGMLNNRSFAVVRDKIPWNCIIISNGIDCSLHKAWKLFIKETFGINKTAHTKRGGKYMNFLYFSGMRIYKKFRLVPNPVDIHLLTGDAFDSHSNLITTIILFYESVEVFIELGTLITIRMFAFIV